MTYFGGAVTFIRAQGSRPDLRRFGPKAPDHHTVGNGCIICADVLQVGDYTTLLALGPGEDVEEQERARTGRSFRAVAIEVHWACATGQVD